MPSGIIEIGKKDKLQFKGYVTAPASGVYPGILLLHQEYGIDASIRLVAEYYAAMNYTVFVPDLFWRSMPGCELYCRNKTDITTSLKLMKKYNFEEGLSDVTKCLKWLRETPQCNGLVTTIGYGIGGNLSYLSGLWLDIESSVCYDFYQSDFFQGNDTFIRRPMLIHISREINDKIKLNNKDKFIKDINNIDLVIYEDKKKNFFRKSDINFDFHATLAANKKTEEHILECFKNPHST